MSKSSNKMKITTKACSQIESNCRNQRAKMNQFSINLLTSLSIRTGEICPFSTALQPFQDILKRNSTSKLEESCLNPAIQRKMILFRLEARILR